MRIILASQSPRRRELLGLLRLPFTVCSSDIDETMDPALPVAEEVARVSREKAFAIPRREDDVVIAADTVVVVDGRVLGKPHSPEEARQMLALLSGRDHQVMTGMTVLVGDQVISGTEISDVRFKELTDREIRSYVATGEPMDKAGSYGIQGYGALFVEHIRGDYYNIMGLPVCRLGKILAQLGIMDTREYDQ